jgi:pSer/pThr/pTyr-binding forkhead associated (FHA) protein
MPLDAFLLVLRLLFIVLLYLFLMQVVVAIMRDTRKRAAGDTSTSVKGPSSLGQLVVVDSGPSTTITPGTRFPLERQTYIGRGPTNTIQLTDSFISSEHTHIWFEHGQWLVQDAGSKNGTFVNAQPAYNPVTAKVGDVIRVGFIQFKLTQ